MRPLTGVGEWPEHTRVLRHARAGQGFCLAPRRPLVQGTAPLRGAQVIPDDVLQERGHRTDTMIAGERTRGGDDPSKLDHP